MTLKTIRIEVSGRLSDRSTGGFCDSGSITQLQDGENTVPENAAVELDIGRFFKIGVTPDDVDQPADAPAESLPSSRGDTSLGVR